MFYRLYYTTKWGPSFFYLPHYDLYSSVGVVIIATSLQDNYLTFIVCQGRHNVYHRFSTVHKQIRQ